MSQAETCCTCARRLVDSQVPCDTESEKPICLDRRLDCCGRTICGTCQCQNPRFKAYCPFCQFSSEPSALPAEGLRLPPSYREDERPGATDSPPAYNSIAAQSSSGNGQHATVRPPENTEDTVHFLSPNDSVQSLSLAYRLPQDILRKYNALFSDSLLTARKFILIPRAYYNGPPLSCPPDPEEEERKNRVRRWMMATKCAEYHVAQLYLKASSYELDAAIEAFKADEKWEKEHPMEGKAKQKSPSRRRFGSSLVGQLL